MGGGDCVAWYRRARMAATGTYIFDTSWCLPHMAGILNNQPVGDKRVSGAVWYLCSLLADDRFDSIHQYLICMRCVCWTIVLDLIHVLP